jgi:hypothetical protein
MARGGHGLPKVTPGPSMPYPFTPCGWATPKTALQLFLGWPTHRVGCLQPSSTLLDIPRRTLKTLHHDGTSDAEAFKWQINHGAATALFYFDYIELWGDKSLLDKSEASCT